MFTPPPPQPQPKPPPQPIPQPPSYVIPLIDGVDQHGPWVGGEPNDATRKTGSKLTEPETSSAWGRTSSCRTE